MIAQVALNQKTKQQFQLFSYKVPAEFLSQIKIGQIVQVDFSGKKQLGAVVKFISRQKNRPLAFKLKRIKKIVQPQIKIQNWQMELGRYIAQQYAISFGPALWSLLPLFSHRTLSTPLPSPRPEKKSNFQIKYLTGNKLARWQKFQQIKQSHPSIFIFPHLRQSQLFIKQFCPDCRLFHSGLSASQQTQIYLDCLSKNPPSVAGTFSALFLPVRSILIIEDFLSPIYQKESSPKYEVIEAAKKLAQIRKTPLVLADDSRFFWLAEAVEKKRIKLEIGLDLPALLEKNLAGAQNQPVWRPFEKPDIFSQPRPLADAIHLLFPNSYLSLADYRLREEIFYLLKKSLNLSQNQVIVYLQEESQKEKIRQIMGADFKTQELCARKKHRFPPFWELIQIDFRQKLSPDKLKKISYNIKKGVPEAEIIRQKSDPNKTSFILKSPRDVRLDYSLIYPGIVSRNLKKITI